MSDNGRSAGPAPGRLKLRRDFVAVSKGARFQTRAFNLQAIVAAPEGAAHQAPRFGFTVTKKVGGAVERNRIRRRLREAVRLLSDNPAQPGHDYVIFARREALAASFLSITEDLRRAIAGVHVVLRSPPKTRSDRRRRGSHPSSSPSSPMRPHDKDQATRS